jgi:hypothetical protein
MFISQISTAPDRFDANAIWFVPPRGVGSAVGVIVGVGAGVLVSVGAIVLMSVDVGVFISVGVLEMIATMGI